MANILENAQSAAASATSESVQSVNIVGNYVPQPWLEQHLSDPYKFARVVQQIFIMNAGATIKMRRIMDAANRNIQTFEQYHAWVDNLELCYKNAAICKFMRYTTRTLKKEFQPRDIYRRFNSGLTMFQNTFNPTWNQVNASGISGKTWPEVWQMFVAKVTKSEGPISTESLPILEFKTPWLLAYKFLGPPLEKLLPNTRRCHELFAEANKASARGTGTKKRKSDKLSRRDEREDFARRAQTALKRAAAEKVPRSDNRLMGMVTVMKGVALLKEERKNEFDMLAKTLSLFGEDDSRADILKEKMFALVSQRQNMAEQIAQVRQNLESEYSVSFDATSSVDIDPIHAEPPPAPPMLAAPDLDPIPISVAPRGKSVRPISAEAPISADPPNPAEPPISATVTQVTSHACLYIYFVFIACLLCSQLARIPRSSFVDRQPFAHFECEKNVYVAKSQISGYGLFAKNPIPKNSFACYYSGVLVRVDEIPDSNEWVANVDRVKCIDSQSRYNLSGRWANHSLANNAYIALPDAGLHGILLHGRIKRLCLIIQTLRDIGRNEEITVNYGRVYWTIGGVLSPYYYTRL